MRVLYCNIVPLWPPTMTAIGHTRLVQRLVHAGHQVVAATALYCDCAEAEQATGAKVEPFIPFHVDRFSRLREVKYLVYSILFSYHYLRLWKQHGSFDLICLRNAFLGWCMPFVRRIFGARCVISITDVISGFLYWNPAYPKWLVNLAWKLEMWIINCFDQVFCITEEMKQTLVNNGVDGAKIFVSGDGVDATIFNPESITDDALARASAEINHQHPRVLFYGNIHTDVVDFYLKMVDQTLLLVPEASFIVIGKGDAHATLIDKIDNRPIIHLGYKPHDMLPVYIAACDVGMIPYYRSANSDIILTLKLLEYGAMGLPIVSTPLRAIHRLFAGQAWIRFAETPEAFAQAIAEMLQHPHSLEQSRFFREKYDWNVIMDNMVRTIESATICRRELISLPGIRENTE